MSRRKTSGSNGGDGDNGYELPQAPQTQPVPTGPLGQLCRAPPRPPQPRDRREEHVGNTGQDKRRRPHAHEINAGRCPHGTAREGIARARALDRLFELARRFNSDGAEVGSAQTLAADDQAILSAYRAESVAALNPDPTSKPAPPQARRLSK